MDANPLSKEERTAATATHKASLNIGEVWGLLTVEQKRGVLEHVLVLVSDWRAVEQAINGGKLIWPTLDIRDRGLAIPTVDNYVFDLVDEILSRGDGAWAACINGVPGFENATWDIMWELVSEGQVVDEGGGVYE